jgi:hypothetical protein
MNLKSTSFLDILGISSASICLAHCLIFPVLTMLPIRIFHNQWIDLAFCCIGMFVVSKILLSGALKKVKIILGVSILLVMLGVTFEIIFETDYWLILIGGFGMIVGHSLNFKNHKH